MGGCDTSVAYAETCEEDFMATVSLVRRRPWEGERFNLGKIAWSFFLPLIDPVVGDVVSYEEKYTIFSG